MIVYNLFSCDQSFCSAAARTTHYRVVHLKSLDHKCSFCSKQFSKKHNLDLHYLHCHNHNNTDRETEKCPVCGYLTFAGYQMLNHMKSHSEGEFECKHCQEVFSTRRKSLQGFCKVLKSLKFENWFLRPEKS